MTTQPASTKFTLFDDLPAPSAEVVATRRAVAESVSALANELRLWNEAGLGKPPSPPEEIAPLTFDQATERLRSMRLKLLA